MLYPSIDKLMTLIDSKYSLVSVSARRARLMQTGEAPILGEYKSVKYVGKALEEINAGVLKVKEQAE